VSSSPDEAASGESLSGRRSQARRNDATILAAAQAVFIANPDAPIAAVAKHAGVGISALYRRYPSKEELLRTLCAEGLELYISIVRRAVEEESADLWDVFATFMRSVVESDNLTLTIKLAGRFKLDQEFIARAGYSGELNRALVARFQAAGVLRDDVVVPDLSHIFIQIASVYGPTAQRTAELRARYLALYLDALRAPGGTRPLPGPQPRARELQERWVREPSE
jgi:AcrR family transcriptional regulator